MLVTRHAPPTVPPAAGGYAQAVELDGARRLLFVSGQVPEDAQAGVPDGFEAQCRQAWRNVLALLDSAGMDAADLVKVTTYLTDRSQADANGRIRREVLPPAARPALTVIVAETLESAWLLEIEAIAAR
jgi:2-iminobutanoate/2-iminopropanoate deaminase